VSPCISCMHISSTYVELASQMHEFHLSILLLFFWCYKYMEQVSCNTTYYLKRHALPGRRDNIWWGVRRPICNVEGCVRYVDAMIGYARYSSGITSPRLSLWELAARSVPKAPSWCMNISLGSHLLLKNPTPTRWTLSYAPSPTTTDTCIDLLPLVPLDHRVDGLSVSTLQPGVLHQPCPGSMSLHRVVPSLHHHSRSGASLRFPMPEGTIFSVMMFPPP
jgi:hypothetical protein